MSDNLEKLANWAGPLIERLAPAARQKLLRNLITSLRKRNQARIRAQQNVDGSRFAPRKKNLRNKKGKIRSGAMFTKLRQNRYMRISASAAEASITIPGRAGLLARIHHYGQRDYVSKKQGTKTTYPERQLLGISREDEVHITDLILKHIKTAG